MIQPKGFHHICLRLGASKRERSQLGRNKILRTLPGPEKFYQARKPAGSPYVLFRTETDNRRDDAEVPGVSWHAMGTIQAELGGNKRRGKS